MYKEWRFFAKQNNIFVMLVDFYLDFDLVIGGTLFQDSISLYSSTN